MRRNFMSKLSSLQNFSNEVVKNLKANKIISEETDLTLLSSMINSAAQSVLIQNSEASKSVMRPEHQEIVADEIFADRTELNHHFLVDKITSGISSHIRGNNNLVLLDQDKMVDLFQTAEKESNHSEKEVLQYKRGAKNIVQQVVNDVVQDHAKLENKKDNEEIEKLLVFRLADQFGNNTHLYNIDTKLKNLTPLEFHLTVSKFQDSIKSDLASENNLSAQTTLSILRGGKNNEIDELSSYIVNQLENNGIKYSSGSREMLAQTIASAVQNEIMQKPEHAGSMRDDYKKLLSSKELSSKSELNKHIITENIVKKLSTLIAEDSQLDVQSLTTEQIGKMFVAGVKEANIKEPVILKQDRKIGAILDKVYKELEAKGCFASEEGKGKIKVAIMHRFLDGFDPKVDKKNIDAKLKTMTPLEFHLAVSGIQDSVNKTFEHEQNLTSKFAVKILEAENKKDTFAHLTSKDFNIQSKEKNTSKEESIIESNVGNKPNVTVQHSNHNAPLMHKATEYGKAGTHIVSEIIDKFKEEVKTKADRNDDLIRDLVTEIKTHTNPVPHTKKDNILEYRQGDILLLTATEHKDPNSNTILYDFKPEPGHSGVVYLNRIGQDGKELQSYDVLEYENGKLKNVIASKEGVSRVKDLENKQAEVLNSTNKEKSGQEMDEKNLMPKDEKTSYQNQARLIRESLTKARDDFSVPYKSQITTSKVVEQNTSQLDR